MSRYVNIDKVLKELHLNHKDVIYIDKNDTAKRIEKMPSIDLADYVPRNFHDKTCEAMAKAHQEEIAGMVRVVRCKECKKANTEDCSHSYWDDDWGEWRVSYRGDEWFCADGEREGE